MNRIQFIKTCGLACLSTTIFAPLLQSCMASKSVNCPIDVDKLIVPLSKFIKNGKSLNYLVVNNSQLKFPIYLFKFSETEYSALNMQCSHQGVELSAYGDKLVCSAHGSEFDNKGNATNGPASSALRKFSTIIENQNIIISLKKI